MTISLLFYILTHFIAVIEMGFHIDVFFCLLEFTCGTVTMQQL